MWSPDNRLFLKSDCYVVCSAVLLSNICSSITIACFSNLTATSYALLLSNMCCRITCTCITCITCVTCIKCITCSACYCPISVAVSHGGVYSDALGIVYCYSNVLLCCCGIVSIDNCSFEKSQQQPTTIPLSPIISVNLPSIFEFSLKLTLNH